MQNKFNVGDAVYVNPKYAYNVDIVRGYISSEKVENTSYNKITWEDNDETSIDLNLPATYLLKV